MAEITVLVGDLCWPWAKVRYETESCLVEAWARANVWVEQKHMNSEELARWVAQRVEFGDEQSIGSHFVECLSELNGTFALVVRMGKTVMVAVDRLRSIPVFYGVRGGELILSDDARKVRSFVGDSLVDDVAATEFLVVGYVTGSDTLFVNVKQMQAGEFLIARAAINGIRLERGRHYRYSGYAKRRVRDSHGTRWCGRCYC